MRADPADCLRRAREIVASHPALPFESLAKELRVATCLRAHAIDDAALAIGASRIGGRPDMPASIAWPTWDGYLDTEQVTEGGMRVRSGCLPAPLWFLAQLDLAEVPDGTGLLPERGSLLFFYDVAQEPAGYDPRHRGCARVLYIDADPATLCRRDPPAWPQPAPGACEIECEIECGIECGIESFAPGKVEASLVATLPRFAWQLGLDLDGPAHQSYYELTEIELAGPVPHHRVLGWPMQVQNDMDLECQLVTHGIDLGRGPDAYATPEAERLAAGAADWLLLLQLDSDTYEGPGWEWTKGGCLYFWIRRQDLAARRFENVWAMFQCT